jgi:penicillin-binding protein 2
MSGDNERSRIFTRRAFMIGGIQAGLFTLLGSRVYYLEVVEGQKYSTLAEENRINLRLLPPRRGQIMDRFGSPLAINQQNFRIVLLPERVDDLDVLLDHVNQFVTITDNDRKRIVRDLHNTNNLNAILIKDNLTRDQMDVFAVHSVDLPGTDIDIGEVRTYPYTLATAHVLGYVGTASERDISAVEDDDDSSNNVLTIPGFRIGKSGIEKSVDRELRGDAGDVQMEVNAHGSVVRELARNDAHPGHDVTLGIDIGLQQYIQQRLAREPSAAAVVMDIATGEIRALVSQPSFDPNLFTYGISQDDWDLLNNDEHTPLLNKVTSGVYAPGSTIKPVVAMAALEADILNPTERVFCPGFYELGDYTFHCWKHGGHGHVNLREALAGSCDTFFYDVGHRVGIDRIHAMAKRLGLGEKTGIDLPHERSGFVPSRSWKFATRGQSWQQGETLNTAIGQGYVLTTPLQLAVMAARIANGGNAVKPHIVRAIAGAPTQKQPAPNLGFNPAHLASVIDGMSAVVNENIGTAYGAHIDKKGFEMAGKTGTAQVRRISEAEREDGVATNESLPWKQRDHALFAGFAPVNNPRFAIAVVVEHGGSGAHEAAPIARDILLECQMRDKGTL